nr:MiaB/RimO family radical SAM methylthiotransferase [candidate division KSB1 bacterium]NIR71373.1 MiaB/RimO family radical SAM methylthiotransferase [candidate division KSB1 bacterium]NIS26262.1 MiaB/RimO family radical SAM methylthiotransferase [candidate division KSB1 bacterium]NIT73014.1 MiaB/RimO family radical SAM methylthiotransferase [candidate division KSB1 bacterium]NIU26911.1 MiaB/RimO family radical SAM methylthiotransferase [candidate division KSB1 bacterium]
AKCRQLVRQVLKQSPNAFVAVVGCYAQMGTEALKSIEGVDLIVGNEEKMRVSNFIDIPQKLPETLVRKDRIKRTPFTISSVGNYEHATRANLKIQDGCDFMCSFCIIPFARGRARSRAFWDIQREAIELVERGHKELVLTGVNIGTYEYDGKGLLDVIKMLETVDGLGRIRISSIEPTTIPEALVEHMAESEKLCNHFHIPLQSGDDSVLQNMRRLYSVAEYVEFLEFIHKRIPDVCLGTDVMVGFPGERESEFENTRSLLEALPFAYFHVFSFSERDGTQAIKMADKVSPQIRKARSKILRKLSKQKRRAFYQNHIGKSVRVLMEERNEHGLFQGFTDNYVKVGSQTDLNLSNRFVDVAVDAIAKKEIAVGQVLQVF